MSNNTDDFSDDSLCPEQTSNPFPDLSPDHDIPLESENQFVQEDNMNISADLSSLDLNQSENISLHIDEQEKKHKKLSKDDLKKIPLPIFNCIYCANETVTFDHMINEYLSKEYLQCVSCDDIKNVTSVIESDLCSFDRGHSIVNEMKKCVLDHSEYMLNFYNKSETDYKSIISKIAVDKNVNIKKTETTKKSKEKDENDNNFCKFFKFDLSRKINKEDIQFEEEPFDIWNCDDLSSLSEENDDITITSYKKHTNAKSFSFNENNSTQNMSTSFSSPNGKYTIYDSNKKNEQHNLSFSLLMPCLNLFKSINSY